MGRSDFKTRRLVSVAVVVVVLLGLFATSYALYLRPKVQGPADDLTTYGKITELTYQGTVISVVFRSDTKISLYSASISYTASNHQTSEQSYQTSQMPLGGQPSYQLTKGDALTISFDDMPAGSLLLNIGIQVNASVGARYLMLTYEIPQLETNSSG